MYLSIDLSMFMGFLLLLKRRGSGSDLDVSSFVTLSIVSI